MNPTLYILAANSLDGPILRVLEFLNKVFILLAIVLIVAAAVAFAEGRVQQAIYALIGAAILLMAVPISLHLFQVGTGAAPF